MLRFQHIADGAELRLSRLVAFLEVLFQHGAGELGDAVFLGVKHYGCPAEATATAAATAEIHPTGGFV